MELRRVLFDMGALPYAILTAQPTWRTHGGELAELVDLGSGRVLDLGCGPGESAFGMLDRAPSSTVVGLDLSASMIRFANLRKRFEPHQHRVEFVQGDAMALPYPDASFDAVTGHSFLYLVPDLDRVLAEAARVMRAGARCAFLEPTSFAEERGLGFVDVPREIAARAFREPRFVTSMALWRIVSRGYGRFDEARFRASFERAGLHLVECRSTLGGMGLFGVAEKR
ncbi:MAG: class I SAM-dependent methyltransferase [Polyangiales bacterium]